MKEIQLKCSKARNEYLLNLAAANSSMNKYYLEDVTTLIDVSASVAFSFQHDPPPSPFGVIWTTWNDLQLQHPFGPCK